MDTLIPLIAFTLAVAAIASTTAFWLNRRLKAEIGGLRTEFKTEIGGLRTEVSGLRVELKAEIGGLRTEMREGFTAVTAELKKLNARTSQI